MLGGSNTLIMKLNMIRGNSFVYDRNNEDQVKMATKIFSAACVINYK